MYLEGIRHPWVADSPRPNQWRRHHSTPQCGIHDHHSTQPQQRTLYLNWSTSRRFIGKTKLSCLLWIIPCNCQVDSLSKTYASKTRYTLPALIAFKYGEVLAWLSIWGKVQICIWPSWCHCHSLSLPSVKSRLVLVPTHLGNPEQSPEGRKMDARVRACGCVCVNMGHQHGCNFYWHLCSWVFVHTTRDQKGKQHDITVYTNSY